MWRAASGDSAGFVYTRSGKEELSMEERTPYYRRNLLDDAGRERYDRVIAAICAHEKYLPDELVDS